ncbi:MAG: translocation/assembly module TamB domain-containing protein [bacterium]|nr:translocation/assembly module TamB domain-containing protein [bacterium]
MRTRRGTNRSASWFAALVAVLVACGAAAWALEALRHRVREVAVAALGAGLGSDIAIGGISGDPWRGVVLEAISLPGPPDSESPLLTARRVTLTFDTQALVLALARRSGIAHSIVRVILEEPVLALERDPSGVWNIPPALGRIAGPPDAPAFVGRVIVRNGAAEFVDRRRMSPQIFKTRMAGVNGSADFASAPRIALRASFEEEREGHRSPGRLQGTYTTSSRTLDLDLEASDGDAGAWGPYLIPGQGIHITGGRFGGSLHLLWTRTGGRSFTDYYGHIALRDGRATVPSRRAAVTGVRGEIEVSTGRIRSPLLWGAINGVPLEVRGEASFNGEPYLDLAVRSASAEMTTLGRLLYPRTPHRLAGIAAGEIRVSGPFRSLRAEGRIEMARAQLDGLSLQNASTEFTLQNQWLSLVNARGDVAGGTARGSAWWAVGAPEYSLAVRLEGADAVFLPRLVSAVPSGLRGRLGGSIAALGQGKGLKLVGHASLTGATVGDVTLDALEASFRSDADGVALEHLRLSRGAAWAIASGHLRPGGEIALQTRAGAVELSQLPPALTREGLSGRADFTGGVSGSLGDPELAGTVLVREGTFAGLDFDVARGGVTLGQNRIRLDGLAVRSGRAHFRAAGSLTWRPTPALALDVEVERAPAAALGKAMALSMPVGGLIDGRARIEGPFARPSAAGAVALREAEVGGQMVDQASASFQWDGTHLIVTGGSLRRRDSEISFSGVYHRRSGLAFDLAARRLDLGDLTLPASGSARMEGRLDAVGRITGPPASPAVALSFASPDLVLNGIRFDQTSGEMRWEAGALRLQPLVLRAGGERYEVAGEMRLGSVPGATLSATVVDGRLSTLLGLTGVRLPFPLDGTVSGSADLDGPMANPTARLDLRMVGGRLGPHPIEDGHADLVLSDGVLTVREFELRPGRGRIAAVGRLNLRGENQIEVSGADLELDFLRPVLRLRRPMTGRLDFTMQLGGTLATPEIGFALEIARGGVEGATFDSLVANAYYREGLLQVQQALLVQSGHKLRLSGSLPFNPALGRFDERRPVDLRLGLADVNLGLLRLVTDVVEEGTGAVEGEIRIGGTVGAPRLAGGVRVQDGRLRLRGIQVPVESLRLALQFDETAVRVSEGTARLGDGTVRLEGAARILGVSSTRPVLAVSEDSPLVLQASGARIAVPPYVDARASGSVRLWGTLGDARRPPTAEGRLTVSEGTVSITSAAGPPIAPRLPLAFRGLQLEAGRSLAVNVGGLKFDIMPGGSLLLTGTLRNPMLEGTVHAQEGTVAALGAVFSLKEGTATFQPHMGLRPVIAARAETQAGATHISLGIRGTAPDGLVLDLHSDPERPRGEIVALLAQQAGFARLIEGDVEGALRAEIGRLLFGRVSLALGRAIGLTELVIEYDFERPLALRAGKRLLPNLYLTAQTTFDERTRWLWALEYRFNRAWQFALRSDSAGHWDAIFWYATRF